MTERITCNENNTRKQGWAQGSFVEADNALRTPIPARNMNEHE